MADKLTPPLTKPEDPYWGLELDLARRMGGVFLLIGAFFSVALFPFSPPSDQIGYDGWWIASGLTIAGVAVALLMLTRPGLWTYPRMAAVAFGSVCAVTVGQWLAGGTGEPYELLLFVPVLFVCAIYPPRIVVPFMAAAAASLAAPLVYDQASGDQVANALGAFLLMVGIGAAIHYMLLRIRVQGMAMAEGEQHARTEARVDELTRISNRRAFEETLVDEISRADRMGTPLSMAMGDIEHFKQINDEFGHLEGDRCLNAVAQAMDSELRVPDRVFRWGGDEFVLLLPGTDKYGADAVIERIQATVSAACPRPDNESIWIHFAAAELEPDMSGEELCSAADLALMAERAQTHRART
jgi:diguanylate cyclase (GGDEF)-like protein